MILALLDRRRRWDYLLLALIGGLPGILAWWFDLHRSFEASGQTWVGFYDKPNMWPQFLLLPLFAWLVRWTLGRVADVSAETLPASPPPIIRLFPEGAAREQGYLDLRSALGSRPVLLVLLSSVALVMALDTSGLVVIYLTDDAARVTEADWSVMYLAGAVSKGENLLMVASAYLMQTVLFLFRFVAMVVLGMHNLFFLRHVWQRRRATAGDARPTLRIDLEDPERCLGMRGASEAFNTQVILLGLGGATILLSRFAQFSSSAGLAWADLMTWPPRLAPAIGFPDAGQWILASAWLVSMTVALLPIGVKLLPLFGPRGPELSLTEYLEEFLPEEDPEKRDAARSARLASRFAEHAFWPSGDNRAGLLFFFSAAVLLVVLYPLRVSDPSLLLVLLVLLALLAWLLGRLVFAAIRLPLAFVDERLLSPRSLAVDSATDADAGPIELKVFLSYRRDDSRAYVRLVQKALLEQMRPADIFMDIESLHAGEDFVDRIDEAVRASDVMLVLIGPDWVGLRDDSGRRRLDVEDDFVVQEIRMALDQGLLLIPVLVGGAAMPGEPELPEPLKPLWRLQARALDDGHWDYDVGLLLDALRNHAVEIASR